MKKLIILILLSSFSLIAAAQGKFMSQTNKVATKYKEEAYKLYDQGMETNDESYFEECIAKLMPAIEIEPDALSYFILSVSSGIVGITTENETMLGNVMKYMLKAEELYPGFTFILKERKDGDVKSVKGVINLVNKTIEIIEEAYEKQPSVVHLNLAMLLSVKAIFSEKEELFDETFEEFEKARKADPSAIEVEFYWADCLVDYGRIKKDKSPYIEALKKLQKVEKADIGNFDGRLYYLQGKALYEINMLNNTPGENYKCVPYLAKTAKIDPKYEMNIYLLGDILTKMITEEKNFEKHRAELEPYFDMMFEIDRSFSEDYTIGMAKVIIKSYSRIGDKEKALEWFEILLAKNLDPRPRKIVEWLPDFTGISHMPKFKQLLDKYRPE